MFELKNGSLCSFNFCITINLANLIILFNKFAYVNIQVTHTDYFSQQFIISFKAKCDIINKTPVLLYIVFNCS